MLLKTCDPEPKSRQLDDDDGQDEQRVEKCFRKIENGNYC